MSVSTAERPLALRLFAGADALRIEPNAHHPALDDFLRRVGAEAITVLPLLDLACSENQLEAHRKKPRQRLRKLGAGEWHAAEIEVTADRVVPAVYALDLPHDRARTIGARLGVSDFYRARVATPVEVLSVEAGGHPTDWHKLRSGAMHGIRDMVRVLRAGPVSGAPRWRSRCSSPPSRQVLSPAPPRRWVCSPAPRTAAAQPPACAFCCIPW